ncbi:MAG: DUF4395 family protein [Candidatus Marinimicrobia bacterium]|nr:DUF4395 family protein [Candidatus Neomarinimicrobiota bacterium]
MKTIPRPMVQANRGFLLATVLIALLTEPLLMLIPLAVGLSSLFFRYNPIMITAKYLLRKPAREYHQEDRADQRFNQWIAVSCLFLSIAGFILGLEFVGYLFAILVAAAATIALMGFCVGCYIRYKYTQWKFRNQSSEQPITDKTV